MRIAFSVIAIVGCVHCASAFADAPKDATPPQSPKVDVNSATVETLRTLEGITAARAALIVERRCYEMASEIVDKKAVTKSVYDKIKDQVIAGKCVQSEQAAAGAAKSDAKDDGGKGSEAGAKKNAK